jgi:hypothetical protein
MRKPKYLAMNVKLGLAGSYSVGADRVRFHDKVVRIIYGEKREWVRLGLSHTSPFDYEQIASNTAYISDLVDSARYEALEKKDGKFDVLLIDFSNNEFDLLREPILMQLADVFDRICSTKICKSFLLLLPELPAPETASIQHFSQMRTLPKRYRLAVISNDGNNILIPKKGWNISSLAVRYQKQAKSLEEDASHSFENKIVRRLGHFKREKHIGGCRSYSYATDNCVDELVELIKIWWSNQRIKPKAIVYDSRNNPSLAQAIKAFSASKKLFFQRVDDVVSLPEIATATSTLSPCLLILDVIETGSTLLSHANRLKGVGVNVSKDVLAAISKGANKQTKIREFNITSFASKPGEPETAECVQCRLGLPHTSDDEESFLKLRSFDMWEMARSVGWEPETDVPDNIGEGYQVVPRFTEMLKKYGDWIAYKMQGLYTSFPHPDNVFVIHPDEDGANALSDKLRLRFKNKLTVIRVPREAIRLHQAAGGSWKTAREQWEGDETWLRQLESLGDASAIITDIFNASGSTFRSILELLAFFDQSVFCYFPFVDRDCVENLEKYNILRYSLYDWYGPRPLKGRS